MYSFFWKCFFAEIERVRYISYSYCDCRPFSLLLPRMPTIFDQVANAATFCFLVLRRRRVFVSFHSHHWPCLRARYAHNAKLLYLYHDKSLPHHDIMYYSDFAAFNIDIKSYLLHHSNPIFEWVNKAKIDCVSHISCCSEKPTSLCSVYIKALFAPLLSATHCTSWLLQSKQKKCLYYIDVSLKTMQKKWSLWLVYSYVWSFRFNTHNL